MRKRSISIFARFSALAWTIGAVPVTLADYPIAGTAPYQRPEGAPTVPDVQRSQAWYDQALAGVSKPYPASLRFLEHQGNWYTPFSRPGMLKPYDIRGLHTAE